MPETKYTIRLYQDGDESQIIKILENVFGRFPKIKLRCSKKDHWTWKFKDTPSGLNPTLVAINEEGKIIGVSHGLIKWTKIGYQEVLARKGAEVAVHPDYRRMGIYTKLVTERERVSKEMGAMMSYSLISNPIIIRYKRDKNGEKYEPEFPQPLKQLVKIKDVRKFIEYQDRHGEIPKAKMITSIGIRILKAVNRVNRAFSGNKRSFSGYTLKKISRFDDRVEVLWDKVKDEYDFIVVKSKEYLNWRYCDPRGGDYHIWVAEDDEGILGYLVLRINKMHLDHPVGYIMEVLAHKEREEVINSLLIQADIYFSQEKVNAIYFTLVSGHPYEKIMNIHGFIDSMRSPHLFYRPYKKFAGLEIFKIASPDRLHHQFGEYDSL
jgi:predicted N-acetyltransferase YhbS